eukprot:3698818-Rhodomonas_salina.1
MHIVARALALHPAPPTPRPRTPHHSDFDWAKGTTVRSTERGEVNSHGWSVKAEEEEEREEEAERTASRLNQSCSRTLRVNQSEGGIRETAAAVDHEVAMVSCRCDPTQHSITKFPRAVRCRRVRILHPAPGQTIAAEWQGALIVSVSNFAIPTEGLLAIYIDDQLALRVDTWPTLLRLPKLPDGQHSIAASLQTIENGWSTLRPCAFLCPCKY